MNKVAANRERAQGRIGTGSGQEARRTKAGEEPARTRTGAGEEPARTRIWTGEGQARTRTGDRRRAGSLKTTIHESAK